MKHENKLQWYDFLRGIAAIAVLIGHVRALSFVPFEQSNADAAGKAFYFITGFAHEAVVIFFVLSGFFIIRSIHESAAARRFSIGDYAFNRLSRLWVVLIPALFVSWGLDTIGLTWFADTPAYQGQIEFMEGVSPVGKMGVLTLLGNTFFVQSILVPTFGSNGALWSLANEFWYYLTFPLIYLSISSFYRSIGLRIALGMLAVGVLIFVVQGIALYFLIWLMGGVVYLALERFNLRFGNRWFIAATLALFGITLTGIRLRMTPLVFNDFSLGITTVLVLITLGGKEIHLSALRKISVFLSNISYSLYVTHLPIAVLITAAFLPARMTWSFGNAGFYLLTVGAIMLYSMAMYFLFERNTAAVKKYLSHFRKRTVHA